MRTWKKAVLFGGTLVMVSGCSTDLEVNAPYKEITVVYGLPNRTDRTHWVRINKAFLGEGDAFVYAQIPDSNEYAEGQLQNAIVEELDNGNVVNTYTLQDTILNNRVEGVFNAPQHKLYYFRTTQDINADHTLRFKVTAKGQEVSATTAIVNDFTIYPSVANTSVKIGLVNSGGYLDYEVKWTSGKDGRRYQVNHVFQYAEVRNGTDTTFKAISLNTGTLVTGGLDGGEAMATTIDGEDFFQTIGSIIQPDASVEKRIFYGLDLVWWVASDEFHTYLQLADPVSGIVEDRPDFTNVTNGYGLYGSRYYKSVNRKQFNPETADELVNGPFTGTLQFCIPNSGFSCN